MSVVPQKPVWGIFGGLLLLAGVLFLFMEPLENWIYSNENTYTDWLSGKETDSMWLLPFLAFLGGLISSLSPCILALLPANLSYIGTLNADDRQRSVVNALAFVMGVVTVLSLFGLVSAFAGAVIVDYKGYVHLAVGLLTVFFAMGLMGWVPLKLPAAVAELPANAGPFMVGSVFALVTSPCASPVLFSLMLAAASEGTPLFSVAVMVGYALGYTAVIFVCSTLTGLLQGVLSVRGYAAEMKQVAVLFLILTGVYYIYAGFVWF